MGWKLEHRAWWFHDVVSLQRRTYQIKCKNENSLRSQWLESSFAGHSKSMRHGLGLLVSGRMGRTHKLLFLAECSDSKWGQTAAFDQYCQAQLQKRICLLSQVYKRDSQTQCVNISSFLLQIHQEYDKGTPWGKLELWCLEEGYRKNMCLFVCLEHRSQYCRRKQE